MYAETVTVIALMVAFASVGWAVFTVQHVKKQIVEMDDVLEDVKNGNGNRRILEWCKEAKKHSKELKIPKQKKIIRFCTFKH